MHEIEHLVKMANQIADNFSFHEDGEGRIRDHLQRFWAPSMRAKLAEYEATDGAGLKAEVRRALREQPES